jgi:hypothetical protein
MLLNADRAWSPGIAVAARAIVNTQSENAVNERAKIRGLKAVALKRIANH